MHAAEVNMQYERAQQRIKRLEADVAYSRGELEMWNAKVEAGRTRLPGIRGPRRRRIPAVDDNWSWEVVGFAWDLKVDEEGVT